MAARRVMGNDPFKRGAAVRAPLAALPPQARVSKNAKSKKKLSAVEPVAHADAPEALSLDGPQSHGSSPRTPFDPIAHDLTPDAVPLEVGTPHVHSPAPKADPVAHAAAPDVVDQIPAAPAFASPSANSATQPGRPRGAVEGLMSAARAVVGLVSRSSQVDSWGKDEGLSAALRPFADLLYETYWRVSVDGAHHVPSGPCIIVANHAGALPLDGPMLHLVLRRERPDLIDSRWLLEDQIFHAPVVGALANRLGAVRASPENAHRLLDEGRPVLVFPEGFQALSKPANERYQLRRFGRGGYVKIAARQKVPVVPVAIVGGEEAMPLLAKVPAGVFGLPYVPITVPPLPVQWRVKFGAPVVLDDAPDDLDANQAWVRGYE